MGFKKLNPRLVKIHRNYTIEEIAQLFGIHKNTVRGWIKRDGLPLCDDQRPFLIVGQVLRDFLEEKRSKNKCSLGPGEIYCLRCRTAKKPSGGMADFQPITQKQGNLIGICPSCDSMMFRRVSVAKLAEVSGDLDVSLPLAGLHIV